MASFGKCTPLKSTIAPPISAAKLLPHHLTRRKSKKFATEPAFVAQASGTNARITCTRKTTPGLRSVEKLAVLHGGGANHRYSLSDAVLIKDNHIAAAGGVAAVLTAAKRNVSHMTTVEIEVDTLDQLADVLAVGGAQVVLLDNMDNATLRQAVAMVDGRLVTEASGNVVLDRIASIAATGVDYISSGVLTHSVTAIDVGLDF
ncbi:MAG: carboxylating nicotinate-nucleotide diphosphorylase [Alphaproteobacteria bacterium]|nr:carboxylating nicotinate-nucleotide diphosphorylase [Alphaproteobacteria bacterium]